MEPELKRISCLVIGDPHFKVDNIRQTDIMVTEIEKIVKERRPTFIVCLGDVLHQHKNIHVTPLENATKFLHMLSEHSPTFLLIGNHDRPNNSNFLTTEHPFNSFKHWTTDMTVVDRVVVKEIQGFKFVFVPFVPPGMFSSALETVPNCLDKANAIFAHQEFSGVNMGRNKISEVGNSWPKGHPLVITGHIHEPSVLQDNVIYVGSPYQLNFGDGEDKYVNIFTFVSDNTWERESIDLGVPRKRDVLLGVEDVQSYIPPENVDLRIKIFGTGPQLRAIGKLDKILEWQNKGIKIVYSDTSNKKITPSPRDGARGFSCRLYKDLCSEGKEELRILFEELFDKPQLMESEGD